MKEILHSGGHENSNDAIEMLFDEELKGLLPGLLSKPPTEEELVHSKTLNANVVQISQVLDVKKDEKGKICFHCSFCKELVSFTSQLDRLYSMIMRVQKDHYLNGHCRNEKGTEFAAQLGETKVSRGGHRGNASVKDQQTAIVNLAKAKGYTDGNGYLEHSTTKISSVE